ncbi:small conductance mechanosensitive channel [Pseudomonas sp. SORGH_AS199]|uniref:Small-conductance mechanosensitive channel n=2 Tax=Pseudomonas TaxID=286 RepID=A0ABT6IME6_9PSED|nr:MULTISPECIES: mechanosensitive ion channel domain-containing protein [Pseudomonas]MDH4765609.1 mechanosensitive ion channel [Pseudomonas sp. CBMAI 2609]MDR6229051.1 small conductance mechanosensitive channel [Pseudomonas sp. SORGH_AS_0199]QNQ98290.1 mechanosensitive ion channel protein MscS [Pseudomonas psychrotolerans]
MDIENQYNHLLAMTAGWLPIVLQYSGRVLLALLTLAIGWWLINKVSAKASGLAAHHGADPALLSFLGSLVSIILKILLAVSAASMIGIATTSFVAIIGAAGLAVGLALQGSLSNFAGGVLILTFRPFRVGEFIEAQGVMGTVNSIQIFHTILLTGDNKTVTIPNGNLSNGIITNYSRQPKRKVIFDVGVDYEADLQKGREVLLALAEDSRVHRDPAAEVVVSALGDSAITLSLRFWTDSGDYWPLMFMLNEQVRDRLGAVGIGIPFPQRVVHFANTAPVAEAQGESSPAA